MSNRSILQFPDASDLAVWAAEKIIQLAQDAIEDRGRFSIALSGGGTPATLYRLLSTPEYASQIDWSNVHIFWGDERSVPPTDDGSNYKQAVETLLEHISIPEENIWRMKGEMIPAESAVEYISQIATYQGNDDQFSIDCILLGMGTDGHTASLFPGSAVEKTALVLPVTADYDGRPAERITLTAKCINQGKNIFFLATGAKKASMVNSILHGETDLVTYPSQRIQPENGHTYWLLDAGSAAEL